MSNGPPIFISPWSATANYPAGANAWDGNPTKVQPAYSYFQPSPTFAPTAQEVNYLFNQRDQILGGFVPWQSIQWRPPYGSIGLHPLQSIAYDSAAQKWLATGQTSVGGFFQVYSGAGNDVTAWMPIIPSPGGATGFNATGICRGIEATTPANRYIYAGFVDSTGAANIVIVDTTTGLSGGPSPLPDTANVDQVLTFSCPSAIVIAVGATSSADTHVYRTSAASSFATTMVIATGLPVPTWATAQSPSGALMLIPGLFNVGGASASSGPLSGGMSVFYTADGVSWTSNLVTGLLNPSTERVTVLCCGTNTTGATQWTMCTWDGTQVRLYQSTTNGASWTLVSTTLSGLGVYVAAIKAIGYAHVATLNEGSGTTGGGSRIVYSLDGGTTWQRCGTRIPWTTYLGIAGAPDGFLAFSDGLSGVPAIIPSFQYGSAGGIGALI